MDSLDHYHWRDYWEVDGFTYKVVDIHVFEHDQDHIVQRRLYPCASTKGRYYMFIYEGMAHVLDTESGFKRGALVDLSVVFRDWEDD